MIPFWRLNIHPRILWSASWWWTSPTIHSFSHGSLGLERGTSHCVCCVFKFNVSRFSHISSYSEAHSLLLIVFRWSARCLNSDDMMLHSSIGINLSISLSCLEVPYFPCFDFPFLWIWFIWTELLYGDRFTKLLHILFLILLHFCYFLFKFVRPLSIMAVGRTKSVVSGSLVLNLK